MHTRRAEITLRENSLASRLETRSLTLSLTAWLAATSGTSEMLPLPCTLALGSSIGGCGPSTSSVKVSCTVRSMWARALMCACKCIMRRSADPARPA